MPLRPAARGRRRCSGPCWRTPAARARSRALATSWRGVARRGSSGSWSSDSRAICGGSAWTWTSPARSTTWATLGPSRRSSISSTPVSDADRPDIMSDRTGALAAHGPGPGRLRHSRIAPGPGTGREEPWSVALLPGRALSPLARPETPGGVEKTATGAQEHGLERHVIGQYLVAKVQTPEAKDLAVRWAKERVAEEAAEAKARREKP